VTPVLRCLERERERQTDRQTDRQAGRQTDGEHVRQVMAVHRDAAPMLLPYASLPRRHRRASATAAAQVRLWEPRGAGAATLRRAECDSPNLVRPRRSASGSLGEPRGAGAAALFGRAGPPHGTTPAASTSPYGPLLIRLRGCRSPPQHSHACTPRLLSGTPSPPYLCSSRGMVCRQTMLWSVSKPWHGLSANHAMVCRQTMPWSVGRCSTSWPPRSTGRSTCCRCRAGVLLVHVLHARAVVPGRRAARSCRRAWVSCCLPTQARAVTNPSFTPSLLP
jgi:hypothetical protein